MRTGPFGVHVVVTDAEARYDLETGESLHERRIDLLVGVGDGKRPHAVGNTVQKGLAVLRLDQLMDGKRRLQALCQQRLRRSDQQNIGLVISHVAFSIMRDEYAGLSSKIHARGRIRSSI